MISVPPFRVPLVNDKNAATRIFTQFMLRVAGLDITIGTGSPEGVVEALQTKLYMDDAGTAGNILYIKRDDNIGGDKAQGWILV